VIGPGAGLQDLKQTPPACQPGRLWTLSPGQTEGEGSHGGQVISSWSCKPNTTSSTSIPCRGRCPLPGSAVQRLCSTSALQGSRRSISHYAVCVLCIECSTLGMLTFCLDICNPSGCVMISTAAMTESRLSRGSAGAADNNNVVGLKSMR